MAKTNPASFIHQPISKWVLMAGYQIIILFDTLLYAGIQLNIPVDYRAVFK